MTVRSRDVNHRPACRRDGFEQARYRFRRNSADYRQVETTLAEMARRTAFEQDERWNLGFLEPAARGRGREFWLLRDDDNRGTVHCSDSNYLGTAGFGSGAHFWVPGW